MIVKIKFKTEDDKEYTMMFGDSYKKWYVQFEEYVKLHKAYNCIDVSVSKSKWIGWGGLKWCNENEFQYELNREGRQEYETDNHKSRKYLQMSFSSSIYIKAKVNDIISLSKSHNEWIEARNKEWKQQLNK